MKNFNSYLVFVHFLSKCNHDFSVLALLRVLAVFGTSPFYIHLGHMWTAAIVYSGVKNVYCPLFKFWKGRGSGCFPFPPTLKIIHRIFSKYRTTKPAISEQISGYLFPPPFLKHKRPIDLQFFFLGLIYFFDTSSQSKRIKIMHCWTLNRLACFTVCTLYIVLDETKGSLGTIVPNDLMQ